VRQRRAVVFEELDNNLRLKFEVAVETAAVVRIHGLIKNFIIPWEEQNPD
jgi:hypothetical protein